MKENDEISKQLQELVSWSVGILGETIKKEYGIATYNKIENLRKKMKEVRGEQAMTVYSVLSKELKKLETYSDQEIHRICYSFSLMLELINRCESAYRSHRLNLKEADLPKIKPEGIIFVLTAHPTEARSPEFLHLFEQITKILRRALFEGVLHVQDQLYHVLMISLKISLARNAKPSVVDEANNIYSFILKNEILDSVLKLSKAGLEVSFRTWVGGDKDGHPGVDQVTMLDSLNLSRKMLIKYLKKKLLAVRTISSMLHHRNCLSLEHELDHTIHALKTIESIKEHDGLRVLKFIDQFKKLINEYEKSISVLAPELDDIVRLLWTFPALVVPLEIREDSEVVAQAISSNVDFPITKMLSLLESISYGYEGKWYVRGFVLSMVESDQDILNGLKLSKSVLKGYKIPVVPLFENEKALTNATDILKNVFLKNSAILKTHQKKWGGKFEIMVGYSDSSKENGVLPSRIMLSGALTKIEKILKSHNLKPVFFHGSGGSIERGGGSLKEQTSWWPKSALNIFKSTIQGEMVARNFSSHEIFEKQVSVIAEQFGNYKKSSFAKNKTLTKFSESIRKSYSDKINNDEFLDVIQLATPYSFLHHLKIGSRPTKRAGGSIKNNLRAIPWILCWTQTRILFPTWWGVGSAWSSLDEKEKNEMIKIFKVHPVLRSYVKALGFTLAKIELGVWKLYLSKSTLNEDKKNTNFLEFELELNLTIQFFKEITGNKEFLWFRPWLQKSIDLRSSMIHPINLCQLESLRRNDHDLLRTSVTGISCGMLTTG